MAMSTKTIRDGKGQILGNTTKQANGDVVARDRSGKILGHSSSTFGNTRDGQGRLTSTNSSNAESLFRK